MSIVITEVYAYPTKLYREKLRLAGIYLEQSQSFADRWIVKSVLDSIKLARLQFHKF